MPTYNNIAEVQSILSYLIVLSYQLYYRIRQYLQYFLQEYNSSTHTNVSLLSITDLLYFEHLCTVNYIFSHFFSHFLV